MRAKTLVLLVVMFLVAACGPSIDTPVPTDTPIPATTEPPAEVDEPAATSTATATQEIPPPTGLDGQALLQDRCTACHSLSRIEAASKTAQAWEATVNRMVGYGVELSADELQVLVQYLAETYP